MICIIFKRECEQCTRYISEVDEFQYHPHFLNFNFNVIRLPVVYTNNAFRQLQSSYILIITIYAINKKTIITQIQIEDTNAKWNIKLHLEHMECELSTLVFSVAS